MDAIILVGGQGTRLRPLTLTRHKSLVPLCNRPAIEHLFDWVLAAGFDRAILALGQHNEDLAAAYPPGTYRGLPLVHVHESERLESGGAIRHAVTQAGVEGRFVVLNGDVLVEFDFARALNMHTEASAELTLALYPVADPSQFGVAVLDERSMVTRFVEKPALGTAPSNLVNAGVWIFEPGLVAEIPPGAVRVEETLFPTLVENHRRGAGLPVRRSLGRHWHERALPRRKHGNAGQRPCVNRYDCVYRGHGGDHAHVCRQRFDHRSAAPGSPIRCSGTTSMSDADASITGSIVADHTVIGAGAELSGAVIGSGCNIAPGSKLPAGTSLQPGTRYDGANER